MSTVYNANYAESFVQNYTRSLSFTGTDGRDLITIIGRGNAVAAPSSVTDNSSGTPAHTLIATKSSVGTDTFYVYRRAAISGSPTSLTISSTEDGFHFTWVFEVEALGALDVDTAVQSPSGAYTNSHTIPSFSPANTDGLILILVRSLFGSNNVFGAPTNYTAVRTGSINTDVFYRGTHSSGAQSPVFTTDNSPETRSFTLAWAPSSGGGSTPGSGLAAKTAPVKSLVNGGLVASARRPGIIIPNRKIIIPRRAPLHLGRNFHSEARL